MKSLRTIQIIAKVARVLTIIVFVFLLISVFCEYGAEVEAAKKPVENIEDKKEE